MNISNVSFGRVVLIGGESSKMEAASMAMQKEKLEGKLMVKNITEGVKYLSLDGVISADARDGVSVFAYITGDDVQAVKQKKFGWRDVNDVVSHFDTYLKSYSMSVDDIVKEVKKEGWNA